MKEIKQTEIESVSGGQALPNPPEDRQGIVLPAPYPGIDKPFDPYDDRGAPRFPRAYQA